MGKGCKEDWLSGVERWQGMSETEIELRKVVFRRGILESTKPCVCVCIKGRKGRSETELEGWTGKRKVVLDGRYILERRK